MKKKKERQKKGKIEEWWSIVKKGQTTQHITFTFKGNILFYMCDMT